MKHEFTVERVCRLDGQQPSARDLWTAFYRLWRRTAGPRVGGMVGLNGSECWQVLFPRGALLERYRILCEANGDPLASGLKLEIIRRQRVRQWKQNRLYPTEQVRRDVHQIQRRLCEGGTELTLTEVAEALYWAKIKVRRAAEPRGLDLPADPEVMWAEVKRLLGLLASKQRELEDLRRKTDAALGEHMHGCRCPECGHEWRTGEYPSPCPKCKTVWH